MNALSIFNPTFAANVFDAFDRDFAYGASGSTPRVDVRETEGAYILDMDLPGYSENDVALSLKDRVLTISSVAQAEKEETVKDEKKAEYLIRERRDSRFVRRFSLPRDIDSEKVEANFKNGVLTVTIPRQPEAQPKQILIKTA